jgi:peptidylprolyl isomerase
MGLQMPYFLQITHKEKHKMAVVTEGHNVKVHYKGTFEDGTEFDNSENTGATLDFQVGSGQMIKGFDHAVRGMGVGEVRTVTLIPTEAYGEVDPELQREYPKAAFPPDMEFEVGEQVRGQAPTGEPVVATIDSFTDDTVTLDHNHPLAGKDLTFEIILIESDSE